VGVRLGGEGGGWEEGDGGRYWEGSNLNVTSKLSKFL